MRRPFVQPKPLDDDKIVALAKLKGQFSASLRYRDDKLRAQCDRLVKAGRLRKVRGIHHGQFLFEAIEK